MNVNPIQLINMIRKGQNPQQLMMNIIGQNNNPILENAMNLAQNGNTSALEMIARNLAQQRGLDFDTEFAKFRNYLNQ
jgi:hypothetical protein